MSWPYCILAKQITPKRCRPRESKRTVPSRLVSPDCLQAQSSAGSYRRHARIGTKLGMKEHRASAVADVNDEVDAGHLIWRYRDVCSVTCAHPARGRLDFQADDDGSNGDATEARDPAEWEMSDEDQTEANAVNSSVVDNADSGASAVAEAQAPPQDLCNDLRDRQRSWRPCARCCFKWSRRARRV